MATKWPERDTKKNSHIKLMLIENIIYNYIKCIITIETYKQRSYKR